MDDDEGTNGTPATGTSFSLVRYNNPVLIDKHPTTPALASGSAAAKQRGAGERGSRGPGLGAGPGSTDGSATAPDGAGASGTLLQLAGAPTPGASAGGPGSAATKLRSETEEILDCILPPREWEEDGQLWRQSVSSTPATRLDVINLQVLLPLVSIKVIPKQGRTSITA